MSGQPALALVRQPDAAPPAVHQIRLPFPPSVNGYWRAITLGKRQAVIISERGRLFRRVAGEFCLVKRLNGLRLSGRLAVTLELYPPDHRARDVDNYAKGTLDALTHAGVWLDDEQIDQLHILRRAVTKGGGYVQVTIEAAA